VLLLVEGRAVCFTSQLREKRKEEEDEDEEEVSYESVAG
jgi:hypothetical protein